MTVLCSLLKVVACRISLCFGHCCNMYLVDFFYYEMILVMSSSKTVVWSLSKTLIKI